MADLMTELAQVVTDANRMAFDNSDPMRHSKRKTRDAALALLRNAAQAASELIWLAKDIDNDVKDMEADRLKAAQPAQAGADRVGG